MVSLPIVIVDLVGQALPGAETLDGADLVPLILRRTMVTDRRLDRRLLVTYATTVAIFLLLAWRSEVNVRDIETNNARVSANTQRIAAATWDTCHQGAVRAAAINHTYELLSQQLTAIPGADQAAHLEAVIYAKAALVVPDCGPKP